MSGTDAVDALLSDCHFAAPHQVPMLVRRHARALGCSDALIYLADLQQSVLVPFLEPGGVDPDTHVEVLSIDSTLAGRCFQHVEILSRVDDTGEQQIWLPLLDGTERLGALLLSREDAVERPNSGAFGAALRRFASLIAEVVMSKTLYGDTIVRLRRTGEMGLAAELQWSLLPPLTFACRDVTVSAALEPAYSVAGDTVDYAVDAGITRAGIFDGMGHGLGSAQLASVAVAAYRNARRNGRDLPGCASSIDGALHAAFSGTTFTTAALVELHTETGLLQWVNAGHPEPVLLREGKLVRSLHIQPTWPLGLRIGGGRPTPAVGTEQLQPGDLVLLFTDGVVEARSPDGQFFGEQRLIDLVIRNLAAGLPSPETMRRVVRALLEHQQGQLNDDASLLMLEWRSPNMPALVPDEDMLPGV